MRRARFGMAERGFRILSMAVVFLLLQVVGVLAQVSPGTLEYIERSREGWFFYKNPPVQRDEVEDEEQDMPPQLTMLPRDIWSDPAKHRPLLKKLSIEGMNLERLPAMFLKELVEAKKEMALDVPTVPHVTDYLTVQQAAFDRSQKFTDAYQLAMYTNPQLDSSTKHPTSAYGHQIEAEVTKQQEEALLASASEEVGLFFFFTSTCPYCKEQAKIVKLFADQYDLKIFPVSLDGQGLPEYPRPVRDNGMADKIGVHIVPAIYLAIPHENFLKPIGAGLMTLNDLRDRVLVLLQKKDLLLQEQKRSS